MPGVVQPVLTIGDPRLETPVAAADLLDPALPDRLADLHATLDDFRTRVGFGRAIAAPQIGFMRRCIALNLGAGPVSILNPEITWRSQASSSCGTTASASRTEQARQWVIASP